MDLIHFAVSLDVDSSVARLKAAAASVPMWLVAHIDGQANCAKMGLAVPAAQVLEIFRPDYAARVWAADKRAGIDIPIRIFVCENEGRTWVTCRMPSVVFRPYGHAALTALGTELDAIFATIFAALDEVREATT